MKREEHSVVINGVTYIPAKDVVANEMSIAKGLLFSFWGSCSDEEAIQFINDDSIYVNVNDSNEGYSLRATLDDIAKQA